MTESKEMVKIAWKALDERKGEDIIIIDISDTSVMSDYFIIVNGRNENQVRALVDQVEEDLAKADCRVMQREGYGLGNWVLLDYGDIVVHVFDKESRIFYDLERIWQDGKRVEIQDL